MDCIFYGGSFIDYKIVSCNNNPALLEQKIISLINEINQHISEGKLSQAKTNLDVLIKNKQRVCQEYEFYHLETVSNLESICNKLNEKINSTKTQRFQIIRFAMIITMLSVRLLKNNR